jgi:hypothetical protein
MRNPFNIQHTHASCGRHVVAVLVRLRVVFMMVLVFLIVFAFVSFPMEDLKLVMLREQATSNNLVLPTVASTKSSNDDSSSENTHLQPCRVAVTNSARFHYETLESIAALLPLQYLSLPDSCNKTSLVFDYHVYASRERVQSWVFYFHVAMQGMDVSSFTSTDSVKRAIGHLFVYRQLPKSRIVSALAPTTDYDATIEASCYCSGNYAEWMDADPHRSCIFHEKCPLVSDHPRALWLSPHHSHYYIPTLLPRQPIRPTSRAPHQLCIVGGTDRRNWSLLQSFLDQNPDISSRLSLQILGFGDYPIALENYRSMTNMTSTADFAEFHRLAAQCNGILMLVSKTTQPNYFVTTKSLLKLSGTLPVVLAYQTPVVLHQELYELYKDHMSTLAGATHTDDAESFAAAMMVLLDKLDAEEQSQQ